MGCGGSGRVEEDDGERRETGERRKLEARCINGGLNRCRMYDLIRLWL